MNWQEEFDNEYGEIYLPKGYRSFKDFISTEIIEKLIEDIPDEVEFLRGVPVSMPKEVKQQLREKWLGKEGELKIPPSNMHDIDTSDWLKQGKFTDHSTKAKDYLGDTHD